MRGTIIKRAVANLLAVIFLFGAVLLPALHRAQCHADHHDTGHTPCAICKIATAPLVSCTTQVAAVALPTQTERRVTLTLPAIVVIARSPEQARAPPVA